MNIIDKKIELSANNSVAESEILDLYSQFGFSFHQVTTAGGAGITGTLKFNVSNDPDQGTWIEYDSTNTSFTLANPSVSGSYEKDGVFYRYGKWTLTETGSVNASSVIYWNSKGI